MLLVEVSDAVVGWVNGNSVGKRQRAVIKLPSSDYRGLIRRKTVSVNDTDLHAMEIVYEKSRHILRHDQRQQMCEEHKEITQLESLSAPTR